MKVRFSEILFIPHLINDDFVSHELEETAEVPLRFNSWNLSPFFVDEHLKFVLKLLFQIKVLQVINDRKMIDVTTTLR